MEELSGLGAPRGGGGGPRGGGPGRGSRPGPGPGHRGRHWRGRGYFPGRGFYPASTIYYDPVSYFYLPPPYVEDGCVQINDVVVCPVEQSQAAPVAELSGMGWSPYTLFRRATTPAPPQPPRERPWLGRLNTEYAEAYLSCRDRNPEDRLRARGLKPFTPEDPCWDVWRIHEPDTAARRLLQYRAEQEYQAKIKQTDEKARLAKIRQQFPGKQTLAAPLTVQKPTQKATPVPIPYPEEDRIDYREPAGGGYRPKTIRTLAKYPTVRLSGAEARDQSTPVWVLLALGVGFWALS